ncbi:MAG TPA: alpha-L-arabinofuranosidase C-terminal domain-containing protein, partial [Asanoa sp.]
VPVLDAVAVLAEDPAGVVLFAVNRDQRQELTLDVVVRALPDLTAADHVGIADDDPEAVNDADSPDRVTPRRIEAPKLDGGRVQAVLPALSWNMIRLT